MKATEGDGDMDRMFYMYYTPEFNDLFGMSKYYGKRSSWYADTWDMDEEDSTPSRKTPIFYIGKVVGWEIADG